VYKKGRVKETTGTLAGTWLFHHDGTPSHTKLKVSVMGYWYESVEEIQDTPLEQLTHIS